MPPTPVLPSNIRAYVHWKEPAIYAGEEIECIITFKNTARLPRSQRDNGGRAIPHGGRMMHSRETSINPSGIHSRTPSGVHMKAPTLSRAPSAAATSARGTQGSRGHRPSLSLNVVSAHSRTNSGAPNGLNTSHGIARPGNGHGRSLSIMSLGSEAISEGRTPVTANPSGKRTMRPHTRSASSQYPLSAGTPSPALLGGLSPRQPSPLYEAVTPPESSPSGGLPSARSVKRPGWSSAGNTPHLGRQNRLKKQSSLETQENRFEAFKFPPDPSPQDASHPSTELASRPKLGRSPSTMHSGKRQVSPRPTDGWAAGINSLNPLSRVMSETSQEGTPRTSSEMYAASNHSDETMASELPHQQQFGRLLPKFSSHSRQASRSPQNRPAEPETLMMAYAQTMGQFTLDGSLVNAAPFEEVKRKGVQGGGGVIGVERSKRTSGLFGALGWGNLGESLGGLLGSDEMSSMAQMKASAGMKTIPLLSTPQSLLFVDLKLGPGESRSYSYRFSLPRGLPPTYKGRTMKVNYHLSLGVQRPEGQKVKHVEIPFRVLGSYDTRGDILGHNLMSPYILLQDAAQTMSISPDAPKYADGRTKFLSETEPKNKKTPKQGLEDFLRYTERLLETGVDDNGVLLSPTSPSSPLPSTLSRQGSTTEQPPAHIKEAIDFAILRSNHAVSTSRGTQSGMQSANRFNIARSGEPVGVLTMLRPYYRLGEAVTGTIDFTAPEQSSDVPLPASTYSILVELESTEHVDPSLALRSGTSIARVTRKVYASVRENSVFARQISFNLAIPSGAAPTFETTGVSLNWRLKVEFTAQRQSPGAGADASNRESNPLEELGSDERGRTMIAKERLPADTFEIAVPLKVFGAVGIDGVRDDSEPLCV